MKNFTLNQRQHYEDVPYGPALMELVRLLKLTIPKIKVCQRKTGPKWIGVSVLKCHPWIGMLTHTVLEDL